MLVTDEKCVELGGRQPDSSGLRFTQPGTSVTGGSNHDGWLNFGNTLILSVMKERIKNNYGTLSI